MEPLTQNAKLHIALTGCVHGQLRQLYDTIAEYEAQTKVKIDLVICTGDFQSLITQSDLNYLACPDKYKAMGDFQYYYNGKYQVPYLTIFIGGNHEASNVLDKNFYGGWIMKDIFYLGRSGFIKVKGLNIAGISGIFKIGDYFKGHFERELSKEVRSIFHVREYDVAKLSNISNKIDFFISHDWPTGTVDKLDINQICKIKSDWRQELLSGSLGSFPNEYLLRTLKPRFWVCGHMHYFYKNTIYHDEQQKEFTKLIALDKCLKKRKFFEVVEVEVDSNVANNNAIYVKNEWIALTKCFNQIYPNEQTIYDFSKFFANDKLYSSFLKQKKIFRKNYSFSFPNEREEFMEKLKKAKEEEKEDIDVSFNLNEKRSLIEVLEIEDVHKSKQNNPININYELVPGFYPNEELHNNEEIDLGI